MSTRGGALHRRHVEVLSELGSEVADEFIECLGRGGDIVGPAQIGQQVSVGVAYSATIIVVGDEGR